MGLGQTFFIDGCAHYNQIQDIYAKWTNSFGAQPASPLIPMPVSWPSGRNNQNGLLLGSVSKTLAPNANWVVGWALYMVQTNAVANSGIYGIGNSGTGLCGVNILPDWTFALYAGNNVIGTSQETLPGFSVHPGAWYYYECLTELSVGSTTSGAEGVYVTMTFRVNGQVVANGAGESNIPTANLIIPGAVGDYHTFVTPQLNLANSFATDFYIYPLQVGGYYTTFLGDLTVGAIFPNSDVATGWTPVPAGPHFSLINSQFPENARGYVSANTAGQLDNYTFQPIPAYTGSLILVHCGVLAKKDDEGTRSFQLTNANTVTTTAPQVYPGDSFVYYFYGMDVDPATGAPWTQAGFNSSEFGLDLIS